MSEAQLRPAYRMGRAIRQFIRKPLHAPWSWWERRHSSGRSAREYVSDLGVLGWVFLVGGVGGVVGLLNDMGKEEVTLPTGVWSLIVIACFVVASFIVFHKLRVRYEKLEEHSRSREKQRRRMILMQWATSLGTDRLRLLEGMAESFDLPGEHPDLLVQFVDTCNTWIEETIVVLREQEVDYREMFGSRLMDIDDGLGSIRDQIRSRIDTLERMYKVEVELGN